MTRIEWTDRTWNPITGCTQQSSGCAHCYAKTMALRLKAMHVEKYKTGFTLTMHPESLNEPLKWKKSSNIFVCSMSDLFHQDIPYEFIDLIFKTIKRCPQHRFQILTKRAERMYDYFSDREVPYNVWLGVTVEAKETIQRIDFLRQIPASVKFLSCEPLLEDLGEFNPDGITWIICGGESGSMARPMKREWALNLYNLAQRHNIPFFFKQWGTWGEDGVKRNKTTNGKLLDGRFIQQYPLLEE